MRPGCLERSLPLEQSLHAWERINVLNGTTEKIVQTSEQGLIHRSGCRHTGAEKPQDGNGGPSAPEGVYTRG
jgi:hypothetical protein